MKHFTKEEQQLMFNILDDLVYFSSLHPETDKVNMDRINRLCDYIQRYKIREMPSLRKYIKKLIFNYKIKMYKAILEADKRISTFDFINRN